VARVEEHTWGTIKEIGKIRLGIKTCADRVFIRSDWNSLPLNERPEPELLRCLTMSSATPGHLATPETGVQGHCAAAGVLG